LRKASINEFPDRLYKYLPSKFLDTVLKEGNILFRNLTYFRKYEDKIRGDETEGIHVDNPDNYISITSQTNVIVGDFSFLNSIKQDDVFAFCLSKSLKEKLFTDFECDVCIPIKNVRAFLIRCRRAIEKMPEFSKIGLLHRSVDYYKCNEPAAKSIKDPFNIPFFKDARFFSDQDEFRMVFGTKQGFSLIQKVIDNRRFRYVDEIEQGESKELIIKIGNIENIVDRPIFI
jgi:hypothetical protein